MCGAQSAVVLYSGERSQHANCVCTLFGAKILVLAFLNDASCAHLGKTLCIGVVQAMPPHLFARIMCM